MLYFRVEKLTIKLGEAGHFVNKDIFVLLNNALTWRQPKVYLRIFYHITISMRGIGSLPKPGYRAYLPGDRCLCLPFISAGRPKNLESTLPRVQFCGWVTNVEVLWSKLVVKAL